VLVVVTIAAFFLIRLVPGDPARVVLGPFASNESVAQLRHQLGLDEPTLSQAFRFLAQAARLDFGRSITQEASVVGLIGPRIAPSMALTVSGLGVALLIAIPLAFAASRRRDGAVDDLVRTLSSIMLAMPTFWFGILLALLIGLKLSVLPTSGYGYTVLDHVRGLILPAVTLGVSVAPLILRTLRSSLIQTSNQDFIEAARARGLSERRILFRHTTRNSVAATITVVGVIAGYLLSGAVVVEAVFSIPGLGTLLVNSVSARDFPVIQGLVIFFGAVVVVVSILNDLVYVALDPRVRL